MKRTNMAVSIAVVVGVLLAAFMVGLLIRRARTGDAPSVPEVVVDTNVPATTQPVTVSPGRGDQRAEDTLERRAKTKAQRAQLLEQMNSLTPEEKEEFLRHLRGQFAGESAGANTRRGLGAGLRESLFEKWQNLTPEERRAALARIEQDLGRTGGLPGENRIFPTERAGTKQE